MRIALDAMGSDTRPIPDIEGAIAAAREFSDEILLVGPPSVLEKELSKHDTNGLQLKIMPADDVIEMSDKPSEVLRNKPASSLHVGVALVSDGDADAFVTCGNTGAALAIAAYGRKLKRIRGVTRPALTTLISVMGHRLILLDIGANSDCKPEWLQQFAVMGSIYAERALGHQAPRVALLSNGEEEGKGNNLIKEASERIAALPLNYIGNIEPKEMLSGHADVIVTDGFVGNICIKSLEAMGETLFTMMRDEMKSDLRGSLGGLLVRPALRRVYRQVDPFEIGGAPLLGINGVVIIGHGRTNARGVKNAIRQARQAVAGHIIEAIQAGISKIEGTDHGTNEKRT